MEKDKNILFNWEDLTDNDQTAPKKLLTAFKRAGAEIASSWVEGKIKRENGISYRQMGFVFADNQQITFIVGDMSFVMTQVDTAMIQRTQLCGIEVIYVLVQQAFL